jgi:hypothetical protein
MALRPVTLLTIGILIGFMLGAHRLRADDTYGAEHQAWPEQRVPCPNPPAEWAEPRGERRQ